MIDNLDLKSFLQQMLESGKGYAGQGLDRAGEYIGLPEAGEARDEALSNMGKGALAAGALALLLGTRGGRRLTGGAIKLGGVAALGGLAYKAYNDWRSSQPDTPIAEDPAQPVTPIDRAEGAVAQQRSERLIRAMIEAAKADGHIDTAERGRIEAQIERLGLDSDLATMIRTQVALPLDPDALAEGVETLEEAAEIYLVSRAVTDLANPAERDYLERLAAALQLAQDFVSRLERELDGI
jgi:uncharacterized membrane protein YebE (DUF533 family)